jgi:hypothetical protein
MFFETEIFLTTLRAVVLKGLDSSLRWNDGTLGNRPAQTRRFAPLPTLRAFAPLREKF